MTVALPTELYQLSPVAGFEPTTHCVFQIDAEVTLKLVVKSGWRFAFFLKGKMHFGC